MILESLRIKNFRCFVDEKWDFNPHFNILIGNNATGKTTVLDALSIGIASFFLGIDKVYGKTILYKDIRKNTFTENREYQLPCEIELTGAVGETEGVLTWQRSVLTERGNTRREKDTAQLIKIASYMQKQVRNGGKINLPVINYYGTGRLWQERKKNISTRGLSSRFDGYSNALEPISTSNLFMSWMKTRTLAELQTKRKDEALILIIAAVGCFLKKEEKLIFDVRLDSLILENHSQKGVSRILWAEMSDGYRNVIAMAADLAYKCYTLNNHLGIFAAEQSRGVILIDEIDLHLHPLWQKTIVDSFKKAFPNLQFIATTHSPFIIQSLKNDELIDLEGKDLDSDYFRKSIEEITSEEMGVKIKRSDLYNKMEKTATEYFTLLKSNTESAASGKLDGIKKQLDAFETEFNEDPAYVALLKTERKMHGL